MAGTHWFTWSFMNWVNSAGDIALVSTASAANCS